MSAQQVSEATGLLAKMQGPASEAAARFADLKKSLTSGSAAMKALATGAALLMVVDGVMAFFSLLSFSPLRALIEVYIFIAGVVSLAIEGALGWKRLKDFEEAIQAKAPFLYYLSGRGAFYIFFGTLMVAQWPSLYDFAGGAFVIFVGVSMLASGRAAAGKMERFRDSIVDERGLRSEFSKYDVSRDGKLQPTELAALCEGLGSTMSHKELEAAMFMLDTDRSGTIEFEEFKAWWHREGEMAFVAKYFQTADDASV